MKTLISLVLGFGLLLHHVSGQSSWLNRISSGGGCPTCALAGAPLSSRPRGEPILSGKPTNAPSHSAPAQTNAVAVATNSSAVVEFIGFDKLAGYPLKVTDELEFNTNRPAWADAQINAMIPPTVFALDGRRITVEGFMNPVDFDQEKVTEFMLLRDPPACCYGGTPNLHEWVKVSVKPPGTAPFLYQTTRATGVLHVGARRLNGELLDVYRLDADTVSQTPQ